MDRGIDGGLSFSLRFGSRVFSKSSKKVGSSDNEGKGSFEKEHNGGHLGEDACPLDADDSWSSQEVEIFFDGGIGSFRCRAKLFDLFIAFGAAGDLIEKTRMLIDGHMLDISTSMVQVRTGGEVIAIVQLFQGLVSEVEAVFETAKGDSISFFVETVGSAKE